VSADSARPRWPGWGHDRNWAWRLESLDPLRTVSQDYLRSGKLSAVVVLDADLRLFRVADVREIGRAGIFGWRPGFKGTYFRVDPILQFERQLTLDAAKKYVLEFISSHPDLYTSGMPGSELSSALMAARSAEELFASL
jgi:hypothetical protein